MHYEDDIDQATAFLSLLEDDELESMSVRQVANRGTDLSLLEDDELVKLHDEKVIDLQLILQMKQDPNKITGFLLHVKKEMIKRGLLDIHEDRKGKKKIKELQKIITNLHDVLEKKNLIIKGFESKNTVVDSEKNATLKKIVDRQNKSLAEKNKLIAELKSGVFTSKLDARNAKECKVYEEFKRLVKLELGNERFLELVTTAQKLVDMK